MSGECVFEDRQEAADVRVALAAAEARRKLVEQCRAPRRTYGVKAVSGDLADFAGRLQVSVGAVSQGQPGPFERSELRAGPPPSYPRKSESTSPEARCPKREPGTFIIQSLLGTKDR